jgi:hypothetical protein
LKSKEKNHDCRNGDSLCRHQPVVVEGRHQLPVDVVEARAPRVPEFFCAIFGKFETEIPPFIFVQEILGFSIFHSQ